MAPCSAGPARPAGRRLAGSRSRVPAPGGHARRLWVRARGTDGVEVGDLAVEHAAAGRSPAHHFSRSAAPICAGAASMRSVATTGAILERYEDEPAARRRGWLQLWWAPVVGTVHVPRVCSRVAPRAANTRQAAPDRELTSEDGGAAWGSRTPDHALRVPNSSRSLCAPSSSMDVTAASELTPALPVVRSEDARPVCCSAAN
jgi:hypothetical protein